MKNITKRLSFMFALAILTLAGYSFSSISGWDVPSEYEDMENPLADDDGSVKEGKTLYTLHCKSCHGKYGEGDGPKAANLDSDCGDFTSDEFQDQTDGIMFYKTKEGMDEMPEFSKKLDDDEIWSVINYMRTL